ncbi:hypothetical protein BJY24_006096 [Nocardia transvalensis]|uniref:Uncharacterized protein n=1 Tax=Nocardia transvalensis TaxID=37333 RepID=A0A7W9PJ77_9NOCA|nr:hypothetical protein [Nocardia transvalensis]MBB5917184.1 hypothetical protein [Nocardia transvalensis]
MPAALLLAGLFAGISVTTFVWAMVVVSHWGTEHPVEVVGGVGLAVASVGILVMALGMLRGVVPRVSIVFGLPVRRCSYLARGAGVRVSQPTRIVPLVSTLVGLIVFGQACWWAWWAGVAGSFPFAASDDWAIGALVVSVVLFVALILVSLAARSRIHIELYPSGIVRRNPLRDLRAKDRFLPWEDIAGVDNRTQYVAPYLREGPTIVLRLTDPETPVDNRLFDQVGEFGIPAYLARCDSNLLLALVEHLVENPADRHLLAIGGVEQWFSTHHHYPARPTTPELEPAALPQ